MFSNISSIDVNMVMAVISLLLAVEYFMIPLPAGNEWASVRRSRQYLVFANALLGLVTLANCLSGGKGPDCLGNAIALAIASYQAPLLTYTCVQFMKPRMPYGPWFWSLMGGHTLVNAVVLSSYWLWHEAFEWLFWTNLAIYTLELVYYTWVFVANYREVVNTIEQKIDEDVRVSFKRILVCFVFALSVGVEAWFLVVFNSPLLNTLSTIYFVVFYIWLFGFYMRYTTRYQFVMRLSDNGQEIIANPFQVVEELEPQEVVAEPGDDDSLRAALEQYVAQKRYHDNDVLIDDIVAELHTTRPLLHKYMQEHHGVTFRTWRNQLRIEDAKQLLLETDIPTSAIHEAVGFTDRSNFHRVFRDLVGVTPAQYRKEHQG